MKIFFFAFLKSLKKGIGSGVGFESGSGSMSQRYGSGDPHPDPHPNVTDPQHLHHENIWNFYLMDSYPDVKGGASRP